MLAFWVALLLLSGLVAARRTRSNTPLGLWLGAPSIGEDRLKVACSSREETPDCLANVVQLFLAWEFAQETHGKEHNRELSVPVSKGVVVKDDGSISAQLRAAMLKFRKVTAAKDGSGEAEVASAMQPDSNDGWHMVNVKGKAVGGASQSQLYRSKNKALWLKSMNGEEWRLWQLAKKGYAARMSASVDKDGVPRSLLVRILGIFTIGAGSCPRQCWFAMLDAVPLSASGERSDPELSCDVKPHQIGASPHAYASLDACGELLHQQPKAPSGDVAVQGYLDAAQADLCFLEEHRFIDFSWLINTANAGELGAIKIKGRWWHVVLIDLFMGYGWKRHGWRGVGRHLESFWKGWGDTPELYSGLTHKVWASPEMYRLGKFEDYRSKQLMMFQAFASCAVKDSELSCTTRTVKIPTAVDEACHEKQTPFKKHPEGLARKYQDARWRASMGLVQAALQQIWNDNLYYESALDEEENLTVALELMALSSEVEGRAYPLQIAYLERLKATKEMEALECHWEHKGQCDPRTPWKWRPERCLVLDEERSAIKQGPTSHPLKNISSTVVDDAISPDAR